MARCPHLSLEEEGTAPFPFPSPSHHCFVSADGLPIGQSEQQRYCLTRNYTRCPLFLSQSTLATEADMPAVEPEIAVREQPKEPPEHLPAPEALSEQPEVVPATEVAPRRAAEPQGDEELDTGTPPTGIEWRGPGVSSATLRTLAGIVAGGVFISLLCVVGATAARFVGDVSRASSFSLELSSLLPGALLLLSVLSFGGAIALIGVFFWVRRSAS